VKADRARLLVVAAAGIVIAHAADYALAFSDPARRARELSTTGHGYWPIAVAVAIVCGAAAVALAARRGWRSNRPAVSLPATAVRLATGQVLLFTVLETVERLAVGGHPLPFLTSAAFALGVILQVAVAVGAALLLRGVESGVRRLAAALRRSRPAVTAPSFASPADDTVVRWWGVAGDARGPPSPLPA
jgi:hypothetical protein